MMMQQYFLSNQLTLPENWSRHIHCIQSDIAIQTQSAFCWLHCEGKGWKEQARRLAMRNIPTVVVTSSVQMSEMQLAFVLGAKGYCHLSTNTDTANAIVATVLQSGIWIPQTLLSGIINSLANHPQYHLHPQFSSDLTERECSVTNYILEGKSNLQIAEALGITERTVKEHVTSILRKYGVKDRVGLLLQLGEFHPMQPRNAAGGQAGGQSG